MKKFLLFLPLFLVLIHCKSSKDLDQILNSKYTKHFISSGDNFPQISLNENDRYLFLVGLHNGFSKKEVSQKLKWSKNDLLKEVELLKENGYLKEVNGVLHPTISIITNKEGIELFKKTEAIANEIAVSITQIEDTIKEKFSLMEISKKHSFSEFAFFLYSDVLLDNWQINNVERDFLKEKRTLRHGKRYYIQYAEKDSTFNREVFGIYGNQYRCAKDFCFITYGNNRKNHHKTLEEMSTMDIPFLSKSDQKILKEMANFYRPILIEILEKNRILFKKEYKSSVFYNELTFSQYFIWYYHFLYTKTTDVLALNNNISIPETGIFRVKTEK
jgi:hypothetical protein